MSTAPPPRRTDLLHAGLAGTPPVEQVRMTRIELGPGQAAGPHHHPCDVVGTVLSGRIRFQLDGGQETELRAGDAFVEPRDAYVLGFDNAADDEPAVFVACYLMGPGVTEVIVMAPPPNHPGTG